MFSSFKAVSRQFQGSFLVDSQFKKLQSTPTILIPGRAQLNLKEVRPQVSQSGIFFISSLMMDEKKFSMFKLKLIDYLIT